MASTQEAEARQRYDRLVEALLPLYTQGRYAEALARMDAADGDFGLFSSDVTHIRACLQALVGRPERALATLEAGLADGQWWHEHLLNGDDDLAAVRELDGFDELVREAQARADAFSSTERAPAPIARRPDGAARGLLVALHGGDGRAERVADMFAPATARGFLLLAPWSTSHTTPARASWTDRGRTAADVSQALSTLPESDRELPTVVAGFSAGGRAALLWALHADPVPVAGTVLVAPAIGPDLLPDPLPEHLPGLILLGAEDRIAEDVKTAAKLVEPIGVRLEVIEGIGHQEPDDFAERLVAELDRLVSPSS